MPSHRYSNLTVRLNSVGFVRRHGVCRTLARGVSDWSKPGKELVMKTNMIKIGMAALAMGVVTAWAGEKEIETDQLPSAVLEAAKSTCPDGLIKEAAMEEEGGIVLYEVEMMVGTMGCDLKLAADGTVIEKEQQVAPDALPEKIKATLGMFEELKIMKAEHVEEKDDGVFYELNVMLDGQGVELKISEQGKIIEIEAKDKESGEDEDYNDDDDGEDDDDD